MQSEQKNPDAVEQSREQVLELGSDLTKGKNGNIYTLTVIGQIEGHQTLPETAKTTKYEHVLPLLAGIEESDEIDGLLLLLNTVGGDIEAGLAIAELIAGMKKPTVPWSWGADTPSASLWRCLPKRSFIAPTASMTIHPVRMTGLVVGALRPSGTSTGFRSRLWTLSPPTPNLPEDFEGYMMATGEMATDGDHPLWPGGSSGLIDRLGGLHDALECLHKMVSPRRRPRRNQPEASQPLLTPDLCSNFRGSTWKGESLPNGASILSPGRSAKFDPQLLQTIQRIVKRLVLFRKVEPDQMIYRLTEEAGARHRAYADLPGQVLTKPKIAVIAKLEMSRRT